MGINRAADKVKWAAINFMDHTLPRVHTTLSKVDGAMEIAARSIEATAGALIITLFIIALAVMVYCYIYVSRDRNDCERNLNRYYLRLHYGHDIDTMTKTYISLIKFLSSRVYESISVNDVDETKVVLVGANEEIESCVWDRRNHDMKLHELLFVGRRFIFRSIADAMEAVGQYHERSAVVSESKHCKTLFVFILISSQDPAIFGPQCHEPFSVPSSLRDRYAIIGTGFHNVAAHKLSRSSTGADGKPLEASLPMRKEAGVVF